MKGAVSVRWIPNALSALRLILAVTLLFLAPLSPVFIAAYLASGLTDLLDGFIARRFGFVSRLGASLDSFADMVFYFVLLVVFVPIVAMPGWAVYWIAGIVAVRLLSLLIGFLKYRALAILHTIANKVTGLAVFCFPLLLRPVGIATTMAIVGAIASISAIEEIAITLTARELVPDRRSIFRK